MIRRSIPNVTIVFAICFAAPATAQVDSLRGAMDFLVGEWTIKQIDEGGKMRAGNGERYRFRKLAQGSIEADWQINRGSQDAPKLADTRFYTGFDTSSNVWSFYFVSERSAQFWPGTLIGGTWYFHHEFTDEARPYTQRQWWQQVDANTLIRHIEDSTPNGKGYTPVFTATFARTAAP